MTRKHFAAIARAMSHAATKTLPMVKTKAEADMYYRTRSEILHRLAEELEALNPRFDRDKFLTACIG